MSYRWCIIPVYVIYTGIVHQQLLYRVILIYTGILYRYIIPVYSCKYAPNCDGIITNYTGIYTGIISVNYTGIIFLDFLIYTGVILSIRYNCLFIPV